ncbi:SusC/RagA family TonB-linked outer membrane protein [Arachidicoccus ginsenosidimutans]|uniref:SusC/RagA family TonB-linked outer membrane protein n=1 Tax=Arachidicoccus sp. BS20 TaxID=1850526 RepID=UPI0007F131CD|nr:SusC/RagA family TonB-linked outer membrane protein [Arachidicoccus sp. BS20]ANI89642.1 SusC/RagA family TonB-linked outer membrane protein [Arachidicoccus sp. BS20]
MSKHYLKIYVLFTILFLSTSVCVTAQVDSSNLENNNDTSSVLGGIIVDDWGKPLSKVNVVNKNGDLLSVTDVQGKFDLPAGSYQKVYAIHAGFDKAVIHIGSEKNIVFRMHQSYLSEYQIRNNIVYDNSLDSLMSGKLKVLYGDENASGFLGATSTVYGNEISNTPAPQYTYALPGRLSGLSVIQQQGFYLPPLGAQTTQDIFVGNIPNNNSGAGPTDNNQFNIQLRGHAGSAGQSPIVVIDGVQREMYSLDPEEIQSVSILKDALSNILLGQNSSRGALVVTTLQPKIGKPHLTFSAETGIQNSPGLPNPLPAYKYAYLLNEALLNDGKNAAYTADDFTAYRDGSDPYGHPDVDWYKTIIDKNAIMNRYNLNVTGGTNTARYLVSLGYLNQDGFFKTSPDNSYNTNLNLKRYTIDSKIFFKINKDFDLGLNIIGRLQNHNQPGAGASSILSALLTTPNNAYPVYNPDGSFGGTTNYSTNLLAQTTGSGYLSEQERDILVNLDLNYRLDRWIKGWWFKANGNVSVQSASYLNRSKQVPVYAMTVKDGDTTYQRYGSTVNQNNTYTTTSWARYWYARAQTGYDTHIGDNAFGALLMYDQRQTLLNYDLPTVQTNYAFKGYYNYAEKYFAEAAADYGGYDRYESGHRYGLFYAGGLGWDIAKENFVRNNIKWIDKFKIRATYGKTGNANVDDYGYYIWLAHFSQYVPSYQIGSSYPAPTGSQENATLPNVNATWEKAKKLDIGTDISLFDKHLQFTYDYYHERYYDVMQTRGKSIALIGANYPAENIGVDLYTGHEFSLTYQNAAKDFNYFVTGNASIQQSKVVYMDEQYEKYAWNVHTGLPVGERFGLMTDGFIQSATEASNTATIAGYTLVPGDVKYKDLNNDGVIDAFDIAPIGTTKPKIFWGLTFGFSYKGIEFSTLLQGILNNEIYADNLPIDAGFQSQNNGYGQAYEQTETRWTPETATTAIYPRLTAGGNGYNYAPLYTSSALFLHKDNYFRIKNISLAYNLPYKWIKHLGGIGGIKIFVNALNLYTYAQYNLVDPEISLTNYPLQRVFNTGINIKL